MVTKGNIRDDNQKGERLLSDDKVQVWPLNLTNWVLFPGAKITIAGTPWVLAGPGWLQKHKEGAVCLKDHEVEKGGPEI